MDLKCIGIDNLSWSPTIAELSIYQHLLSNSPPENHLNLFGLSGLDGQMDSIYVFPVFSQQQTVGRVKESWSICAYPEDITRISVHLETLSDDVLIREVVESISQHFPQTDTLILHVRDPQIHIVRELWFIEVTLI
jgi:hypothetical protein